MNAVQADSAATRYTWHGIGHLVAGGIGFICLIAACFVLARGGGRGWAIYSVATGVVFLAGFAGIASGNQSPALNLGFGVAVVVAFTWLTIVFARAPGRTDEDHEDDQDLFPRHHPPDRHDRHRSEVRLSPAPPVLQPRASCP